MNNAFLSGLFADQCDTRPHPASVNSWLAHLIVSAEDFIFLPMDYFNFLIKGSRIQTDVMANSARLEQTNNLIMVKLPLVFE